MQLMFRRLALQAELSYEPDLVQFQDTPQIFGGVAVEFDLAGA
jgi:hypothetical protein